MGRAANRKRPRYQQIANILRARIVHLEGSVPQQLPAENELAGTHGVSRGTVRQALGVLASEGLIERISGHRAITSPTGILAWRRLRRPRTISVILSHRPVFDMPSTYLGQIYQGILSAASEAGYDPATKQTSGSIAQDFQPEDRDRVVGVITVHMRDEQVIRMHVEAGYPVVCVDHLPLHPQADAVVVDCFNEARLAVDFLIGQGHRELFYVGNLVGPASAPYPEHDAVVMEAGYRQELWLAGLDASAQRVRYCKGPEPGVELPEVVDWFASLEPRPTAGIVFDGMAMEALAAGLSRYGLRCPDDVSLMCKIQAQDPSKAASLRSDAFILGQSAVELLLERAAGKRRAGTRLSFTSTLRRGNTVRRWDI